MADALVPGRFQPFHTGHAYLLEYAMAEYDEVAVGIATHEERTERNPLTYEERTEMIGRRYDVETYRLERPRDPEYVDAWLEERDGPVVVTANPETDRFVDELDYTVDRVEELGGLAFSGERVRERAGRGLPWRHLVPDAVEAYLDELGFGELMKEEGNALRS